MNYKLVKLQNGTFSVRSIAEGETFHPVIGPAAEAETLYVNQLALPERIRASREPFLVWDVGLGAGANAMALIRATENAECSLCLHSFDRTLEPLQFALEHASQLGYLSGYESTVRKLIDCGAVHIHEAQRTVRWQLHIGSFPELLGYTELFRDISPHAILFDPFSPAANPEMWTLSLFSRIYQLLNPERPCALATYSRSTMLRVSLLLAGFHVGRGHAS
ncbi:MAG: MnmC family methyltransferase, partial [Verrucomicrobiia bacterium]